MASETLLPLFTSIGLSEEKAKDTIKNESISDQLKKAIELAKTHCGNEGISKNLGVFLYHIATKIKPKLSHFIPMLVKYCCEEKIFSELRFQAAVEYLTDNPNEPLDVNSFEKYCGVGIIVTPQQIEETVENVIKKHLDGLKKLRYRYNTGAIMGDVKKILKFADGKNVKNEVDLQVLDLLGPKTEEDLVKIKPVKPVKNKTDYDDNNKRADSAESDLTATCGARTIGELMKTKVHFHKPGENYKTEEYVVTPNTMKLLEKHLKETGGQIRTRFPPEPNGILHVGHAKAININFGYAMAHDGVCILRYDDTNPEKEEEKFFTGIRDVIEWLGYTPSRVTHSSDYFPQLYELAIKLIKSGNAYVCHQKAEDLKGFDVPDSPWRNRPVEESLLLFEDMKNGKLEEGSATLRMRVTMEEGKKDPVAYRIKYLPHPRTGDEWCIYPTYDYAHCLCDSIENITHSLCTREFRSRRSTYYWLCNVLDIYCPVQWEYGRLNMEYTVVSKRKIAKLIDNQIVDDWNDPRLFTLSALKRRGFPAQAINDFCALVGVSTANSSVEPSMLESCVRTVLDKNSPRTMAVINPLKLKIINFPSDFPSKITVPDFPNERHRGSHEVSISDVIYIDESDFREVADPSYRRLTPGQPVGLRHAGLVLYVNRVVKEKNRIVEIEVTCKKQEELNKTEKIKAFVHWVSNPISCEVRLYEKLFNHKNPEDSATVPNGFSSDVRKDSLIIVNSFVDDYLKTVKTLDKFQFERVGYFCVDLESTPEKLVFSRTLQLKEDPNKD